MQRIGVLTSGGDAPGMNAAVRAVTRKAIYSGLEVIGIRRGYQGLVHGEFTALQVGSVADIIHRGGTMLRTARSPEFTSPAGRENAIKNVLALKLDGLVVIGGDGSFRGALRLEQAGIPVIGVPATIDNDLPYIEACLGFDTAVNTVTDAINKVRDTAVAHERVFVVEVMGRNDGHIALAAGLAGGAESILIPEVPYDLQLVSNRLKRSEKRGKLHSIIIVAEGAGSAMDVTSELIKLTSMEVRPIVLGHLQRGGSPTAYDRMLGSRLGAAAVELLQEGRHGLMVGLTGGKLISVPLEEAVSSRREIAKDLYQLAAVLSI